MPKDYPEKGRAKANKIISHLSTEEAPEYGFNYTLIPSEETRKTSPWIRLIQPHAGGGKGFYFLPEIGEEVTGRL